MFSSPATVAMPSRRRLDYEIKVQNWSQDQQPPAYSSTSSGSSRAANITATTVHPLSPIKRDSLQTLVAESPNASISHVSDSQPNFSVTPEIGPIRAHQQIVRNEARLSEINEKFRKAGYDVDNFPHNYPVYEPPPWSSYSLPDNMLCHQEFVERHRVLHEGAEEVLKMIEDIHRAYPHRNIDDPLPNIYRIHILQDWRFHASLFDNCGDIKETNTINVTTLGTLQAIHRGAERVCKKFLRTFKPVRINSFRRDINTLALEMKNLEDDNARLAISLCRQYC
jgi:hypothetical protein